jgi:hypothetical protein
VAHVFLVKKNLLAHYQTFLFATKAPRHKVLIMNVFSSRLRAFAPLRLRGKNEKMSGSMIFWAH